MDPTRPSIHERYAAASTSSHLEMHPARLGAVDMLIAAGVCRDGLGTRLYRLTCEFDAVRGQHHLAIRAFSDRMTLARELAKSSLATLGSSDADDRAEAARGLQAASKMKTDAEHTFTSDRILILSALTSLQSARESLRTFAGQSLARKPVHGFEPDQCWNLADRVLDLWIDPICPRCSGRGSFGGYGTPLSICPTDGGCGGARLRPTRFGARPAQEFGRWLICEMDRKTARVSQLIANYLHGKQASKKPGDDDGSVHELRGRLAELRSAAAQED